MRAMFRWAVSEGRVPDDPTLGVTRLKIKSTGYPTWSEDDIQQYKRRHPVGTMARLAIELLLTTAARRGDVVKFGPQHVHDGTITFEQHKKEGAEEALVIIPLHPDFCAALAAMPPSKVVSLTPTFLTTSLGKPFSEAGFGWGEKACTVAPAEATPAAGPARRCFRMARCWSQAALAPRARARSCTTPRRIPGRRPAR